MTTSSIPTVATVDFQGAQLITIKKDEIEFVAMKPVVDGIGLDWKTQYRKIASDKRYGHMTIPLKTSGGDQKLSCIPLVKLNGWLFTINPNKIPNPQTREKVIKYQEECFIALYDYWHKGKAERTAPETLTPSEQHEISQAVKLKAGENHKAIPEIWGRIKNKFKVAKYSQIPRERFHEVLVYIGEMEVKILLKTEEPATQEQEAPAPLTPEEKAALIDDIYNQIGLVRNSADGLLSFYRDLNRCLNKIGNLVAILNSVEYKDRRSRELAAGR